MNESARIMIVGARPAVTSLPAGSVPRGIEALVNNTPSSPQSGPWWEVA